MSRVNESGDQNGRRRVRRADVAAHAGVSHGTVSHVLNHPERVRPETRERVEASIAALGFVRDEAARHLRAGYSNTIGLLLLDAWNPGFTEVARGVEERTLDEQWTILMSNSARDSNRERRYLRAYAERRVAGLIVVPNDQVSEEGHQLPHGDIPMVLIDRIEQGAGNLSVAVDDRAGGALVAEHRIELGHRRLAFVGNPKVVLPVRARFAGFQQALEEAGSDNELEVIATPLTLEAGLEVGRELAARPKSRRPTAVATAVDLLAIGVLQGLLSAGIRVPDEMSVVGYDDIPFAAQLSVPLTSLARPHRRMGILAADLLLTVLDGREPEQRHVLLEPELVIRASTAEPADPEH